MKYATTTRLKTARWLGIKGFKGNLGGWGVYGVATIMAFLAALLIMGYHGAIGEDGLLVTGSPLNFPFLVTVIATGVYLSVMMLLTVARERESGTMEVLFYGPVDAVSYVLGKFLENFLVFLVMFAAYLAIFWMMGRAANFGYYALLIPRILLAVVFAAALIALGIAAALLMNSVRTAVLAAAGLLLGFGAVQWGRNLVPEGSGAGLLTLVTHISPFYGFDQGLQSLANQDPTGFLIYFGILAGWMLLLLAGAVALLERKGVRAK